MKRTFSLLIATVIFLSCLSINSSASTQDTILLDDGSYFEITLTEYSSRASGTKSGSKKYVYYDSNGTEQWRATLSATFTYTGSSATCTAANITHSVTDSSWKITQATTSKSGNKATGNITAKKYVLGIAYKTVDESITITCSSDGILS